MQRFVSMLVSKRRTPTKFQEIFPKKRTINRILFQLDTRLTYREMYPIFVQISQSSTEEKIPWKKKYPYIKSSDLIQMRNVLITLRMQNKFVHKNLLAMEDKLLNFAAELGNNDAISILSFNAIQQHDKGNAKYYDQNDVETADRFIKELYARNHHLTIKLIGDFFLKNKAESKAEKYYKEFLKLESNTKLAGEVYGKLGEIQIKQVNGFLRAEKSWLECIRLLELERSSRWYFLLAKLYLSSEPLRAKPLLEKCASIGFKESFKTLGFIELNYFQNYERAKEWFKIGLEIMDLECFLGFFDCCLKLKDTSSARNCLESLKKLESNNNQRAIINTFLESRKESMKLLEKA
ncbi:Mss2p SKDI_04G1390 [Saccharomyces kudriavzevii IFO 1802]|uniref:Uncharacterized protein n=2 Tax=Saccharomyces kudriavzevii (strain ATCC MYA-4449 / AS 2.2408 / CBS 8840 / NBRC 1802 / NCYC 2889) TaxID=226230 RepID=A0AA35NR45_SACK1|nr:uncharacterized protein SKDI_04G1390 [Saccharomyces kudriavzevii IFO 1802]EJT43263.1 MSS2-like protein [Saccharomyces kudriavzevii IFO 1802]CAI4057485.1 hypothetical protein SKDI_04G1390 [Saccharomyces kudriavzevii IFO 1802]